MEWRLLEDMEAGRFADEDTMMRAADGNDLRQLVTAWIEISIFIVSAILIMRWIYNANRNVRALGATGMAITPGWSVGWYFVPFANLVMPYRAMSELWRASASPSRWNKEEAPPLLPWWWFSLLVSEWLAQAAFRYSRKAETIDALQTVGILSMLSNVAGTARADPHHSARLLHAGFSHHIESGPARRRGPIGPPRTPCELISSDWPAIAKQRLRTNVVAPALKPDGGHTHENHRPGRSTNRPDPDRQWRSRSGLTLQEIHARRVVPLESGVQDAAAATTLLTTYGDIPDRQSTRLAC